MVSKNGNPSNMYVKNAVTREDIVKAYDVHFTTFTISDTTPLEFHVYRADYTSVDDIKSAQVEIGAAMTAYEPYQGDTFAPDFGQTVYGGTLDWNRGVLVADRAMITLTGNEGWGASSINANAYYINQASDPAPVTNVYVGSFYEEYFHACSHYRADVYRDQMPDAVCEIYGGSGGAAIMIKDDSRTTPDAWKAYLAAQYAAGTPVQVAYRLATPTTIQLTPQQITALAGLNTVWTDLDSDYAEFGHESLAGLGAASEYDLEALAGRVTTAEQKITADAIVSTVTASETYKTLASTVSTAKSTADTAKTNAAAAQSTANAAQSTADTAKTNAAAAQSTADTAKTNAAAAQSAANTAKSTADAAKSSAGTNAANITALTTRVTTAESQITQKADSIELSVLRTEVEGIEIGGTNLAAAADIVGVNGNYVQYNNLIYYRSTGCDSWQRMKAGDEYTVSFDVSADSTLTTAYVGENVFGYANLTLTPGARNHFTAVFKGSSATDLGVLKANQSGLIRISGIKVEIGNKPTDWSPAPEDPAKSLVTGTTVTITDEEFSVQTKQAAFSIIDDSTGEAQEKLRIDEDGLTSEEATFGTVHSDSVVLTQGAVNFTPANAGELQAILDGLSNRFLLDTVTINAVNVSGGEFSVSGVYGNGMLSISNGTFNSLTVTHCRVMTALYSTVFSTSGTAVSAVMSRMYLRGCAINAARGVFLDRNADVILRDCTGTCTTLADVTFSSALRIMGGSVPYGVPGEVTGEVYSPLDFAAAPSAPSVETVQSAALSATTTKTWNGSWLSGNALYQGKTGSDGQLRRGCMWFDTSAISGKTIVSATLKLRRVDGIGGGGSVAVGIYGTTAASASGTPAVGTKYASVSLANGAEKTVDVTAAAQALANGSIKGLMVYDTQTGTFSSKTYTYGYCKLYGSGDSAKPVLNVVYR